ncbi:uncharacterized protein LOC112572283 [Pomacea canaliculata]|uniref:uncharacterized protein LOC112572283 n=1 Tax=Pomacea canaliculata TaxID=400727 RepID=UPI000D729BDA|nr:uncharacterized protein LOC112572283 [Pomacea canaliculata]XP_025107671.1 uncharacterized protein LOC112572283 [Pomacea canaliculata]XP_025107672.1 uncharacterized protein LOC112572283 [Pomacea canaliculata]
MAFSAPILYLFAVGVLVQVTPIMTCDPGQASGCPSYSQSTQLSVMPIPDPEDLDVTCRNLQSGLACLLGPAVLGGCTPQQRAPYTAMSKVLNIPCHRYKQEYLRGSTCWKSKDLTEVFKNCYSTNIVEISTNFCSGGQVFRTCIISDIKMLPGCDISSQRILDIMVTTWYNTVGISFQPTCPELAVLSLSTTTTATTVTTTTTPEPATTTSPVVTVLADLVSLHTEPGKTHQPKQQSTADLQSPAFAESTGSTGVAMLRQCHTQLIISVLTTVLALVRLSLNFR